jgi:hypothetical protein
MLSFVVQEAAMRKPTSFAFGPNETADAAPRPDDYRARLDKATGLRVLCGYPTCTGELAQVRESGRDKIRELVMSPGWRPDAHGVWSRIHWLDGRERAGYGSAPRFRRGQVRNSRDAVTGRKDERPHQIGTFVHRFPIIAVCPRCRHRNVLEADRLQVMTEAERIAAFAKLDNA